MLIHQPGKRRMPLNALTDYIDSKEKEMIELLEKMVNIDCGTYCKEGVNQVGDLLADRLSTLGFSTERKSQEEYGDHIIGHKPGSGSYRILFIGHMDTVFPQSAAKNRYQGSR